MPGRTTSGVQVWSRLSKETDAEIGQLANRMGIGKATLINLCVLAGKGQIMRAVYPEETFTSEQWAKILGQMGKRTKLPVGVKRKVAAAKRAAK